MAILNAEDLIIGEKYWVLGLKPYFKNALKYNECIKRFKGLTLDNVLKHCILKRKYNYNGYGCIWYYCFYPYETDEEWYEIDNSLISQFVFKEPDDCIVSMYKMALQLENVDKTFTMGYDDSIKQKIKKVLLKTQKNGYFKL